MKKEEYMEIGEKFWKMDTAIINFCGMPEDIHPPIKGYIIKGLCLGLTKYNEHNCRAEISIIPAATIIHTRV